REIKKQSQRSKSPAIAIPILAKPPDGLSKKIAAAIPPMTIPAPTLFQNEAANLTRSFRCSVELLSKCSSSRISVLLQQPLDGVKMNSVCPFRPTKLEQDNGTGRIEVAEHRCR